jgi:TonB family protein
MFKGVFVIAVVIACSLAVFGQRVRRQPVRYTATACRALAPGTTGGVLNSRAISLPKPAYTSAALAARVDGSVAVQVLVDESGNVISASAASGDPLLRASAVAAAWKAKFKPLLMSGQPVKVPGLLTYDFVVPPPKRKVKKRQL